MAKKKGKRVTDTKKTTKTNKTNKTNKLNAIILGLMMLSILLGVLIYTRSGIIGRELNEVLGGLFGIVQYIIPVAIFGLTLKLATDKSLEIKTKLIQCSFVIIIFSVICSVFQISSGEMEIISDFSNNIENGYNLGTQDNGGGAIGAIFAIPLINLLGTIGAVILTIGIEALLIVFTFGIDVTKLINNSMEKISEKRESIKEDIRIEREEYQEQKNHGNAQIQKVETFAEKRKREKLEKAERSIKKSHVPDIDDEQIKINFGSELIENDEQKGRGKKYDHGKDDIVPLSRENKANKQQVQPDVIESNLFKQEEEQKEDKTKEVLQLEHTMVVEDQEYEYPPIEILSKPTKKAIKGGAKALTETATKLQKTLYSFGVSAKVENVAVGPTITRYELKPAEGVRVSKIANLADDIALNLAAETIRIEAPIPGKQAVGIEVPNAEKEAVHFREVLDSSAFSNNNSKLTVGLGKDVAGNIQLADIAKMPHVLIAGATGSGKSVCVNTIITSIIYNSKPSEVKFVMIDPKVVELSVYNGIPHLLIPVVTDPRKAAGALAWAVQEMDNRYNLFAEKGVRDLKGYNQSVEKAEEKGVLPQIVIIIDELADLMMVAKNDVEDAICRLAQKARAAGMHLVIATQRPSVDVITGLIKANVPSRIAFSVSSQIDSRTILDSVGAEKLLGKGDMLYYPAGAPKPSRVQGAFVSDTEVEKIVDFIKSNGTATYNEDILETIEKSNKTDKEISETSVDDDMDPFLMEAIHTVIETGQASTSFIQRRFKVGYARAGRIIDQMEERGVISGYQGSKPREVLMTMDRWNELNMGTTETA